MCRLQSLNGRARSSSVDLYGLVELIDSDEDELSFGAKFSFSCEKIFREHLDGDCDGTGSTFRYATDDFDKMAVLHWCFEVDAFGAGSNHGSARESRGGYECAFVHEVESAGRRKVFRNDLIGLEKPSL